MAVILPVVGLSGVEVKKQLLLPRAKIGGGGSYKIGIINTQVIVGKHGIGHIGRAVLAQGGVDQLRRKGVVDGDKGQPVSSAALRADRKSGAAHSSSAAAARAFRMAFSSFRPSAGRIFD